MSYYAPGWPAVYTALRGLCYAEISVRTLERDLHSGTYGGVAPNAIETLVRLLSRLKSETGEIQMPGLYEAVEPPTTGELATWNRLPFDRQQFLTEEVTGQALTGLQDRSRVRAGLGATHLRDPRHPRRLYWGGSQDSHPRAGNGQGEPAPGAGSAHREVGRHWSGPWPLPRPHGPM